MYAHFHNCYAKYDFGKAILKMALTIYIYIYVHVVVKTFSGFKNFQTSLIFVSLCLRLLSK